MSWSIHSFPAQLYFRLVVRVDARRMRFWTLKFPQAVAPARRRRRAKLALLLLQARTKRVLLVFVDRKDVALTACLGVRTNMANPVIFLVSTRLCRSGLVARKDVLLDL